MDAIPSSLVAASLAARERLTGFARAAAAAPATSGSKATAIMAGAAREAIFTDALLSAMRSRLEELKSLAK
jgi:hypothetical protein